MEGRERFTRLEKTVGDFHRWLELYGETSWDHQSFFAGTLGKRAKALYYQHKAMGTVAVAPMVLCEALLPAARRFFHRRIRLPIADAHYAMAYAFRYESSGESSCLDRSRHFLEELERARCPGFREYCWGYPFDWVTRTGTIKAGTPLITTTPYGYEAFLHIHRLEPGGRWEEILRSIARHACNDLADTPTSASASSCSYGPGVEGKVVNASAYRAFLLTSAAQEFSEDRYLAVAERNLNFVLESQNEDGSWPYAKDGIRDFVDHFHTCFVMKALAKIYGLTGHEGCRRALARGLGYYLRNLFGEDGMPRPFSRAPRITVYRAELYDCAECINLMLLMRESFGEAELILRRVVDGVLEAWVKPDGSFRSRRLLLGWDDVPMHRWGQSQMFRSLAFYLREERKLDSVEKLQAKCVA